MNISVDKVNITSKFSFGKGLYSKYRPFFPFTLLNFHFKYSSDASTFLLDGLGVSSAMQTQQ